MAFVRSFLRTYLAGACFNARGLQSVGLVYAMLPGLRAVYADPSQLKSAVRRYAKHYHSHPFWLPCLTGIFLSCELRIRDGSFPSAMLDKVRDTTAYTLSAIGDSVFAGSLLIAWALSTTGLLLSGLPRVALGLGIGLFLALQLFRLHTFVLGIRQGFSVLERFKRWDLINWGQRIKLINGALLVWVWYLLWPRPLVWWQWLVGLSLLALVGKAGDVTNLPRGIMAFALVALTIAFPWIMQGVNQLAGGLM